MYMYYVTFFGWTIILIHFLKEGGVVNISNSCLIYFNIKHALLLNDSHK